jgi:hypothetical protein
LIKEVVFCAARAPLKRRVFFVAITAFTTCVSRITYHLAFVVLCWSIIRDSAKRAAGHVVFNVFNTNRGMQLDTVARATVATAILILV